ncbi:molybdate transport system substrate-binding protein [Leucobacter exalbidus]|uniref:Molybdate transport system substrate-binding protein n=1 Tax=Leucobacter exalbidus TaxID=662960 RepID=A0A940PXT9_9MICO|nr:molybdate ABC transporter substrate-binding protein [Leucobacter exalbidus]MBP1326141.1 molybdate transport system substrate-binding protein [Leucobacter exalbidus]
MGARASKALLAIVALAAVGLGGCSAQSGAGAPVTITVAAAASLESPFTEIVAQFERTHPGITISSTSYDGSSTLATQILEGAPFDVFASADDRNMQTVIDAGMVQEADVFATNTLEIAVPAGNPASITGLQDLARDEVLTVLCAPEVPCGAASEQLLKLAGVEVRAASLEQNVTSVLQKVAAGEADAGLVYRTDVLRDDAVTGITTTGAENVVNNYPIAALARSDHADAAQAFVDFVRGEDGQRLLVDHGFGPGA